MLYFGVGSVQILSSAKLGSIEGMTLGYGLVSVFAFGYCFILSYSIIILYALFYNPRVIKWVFLKVFSFPYLRKWRQVSSTAGDDLILASKEIQGKSKDFWFKAGGATLLSWTARFWVVNFLIIIPLTEGLGFADHMLIYARQLVMWVIMLISPTPGGSGLAEIVFTVFLSDKIPSGLGSSMALLWRLISYYPYLFIGAIILPGWIKRVFVSNSTSS